MYRQTLAASWAAQPGELRADECIENIFAGGDGWGDKDKPYDTSRAEDYMVGDDSGLSDGDPRSSRRHKHSRSGIFGRGGDSKRTSNESLNKIDGRRDESSSVRGRSSLEQQARQMKAEAERRTHKPSYEVNEFEVREDLRSWRLPSSNQGQTR